MFPGYTLTGDAPIAGQFGTVHFARCNRTGRRVAIKHLAGSEPEPRIREVLAGGTHPNVVLHFELHEGDAAVQGRPWVVMEHAGKSLKEVLAKGSLSEPQAVDLIVQVCHGLAFLRDRHFHHLDLKPENIFVQTDFEPWACKVGDLGMMKLEADTRAQLSLTRSVAFNQRYAAPELLRSEPVFTPSSPVYSLALILYEAITGELPGQLVTFERTIPRAAAPLADVLRGALRLDPEARRPGTVVELANALADLERQAIAAEYERAHLRAERHHQQELAALRAENERLARELAAARSALGNADGERPALPTSPVEAPRAPVPRPEREFTRCQRCYLPNEENPERLRLLVQHLKYDHGLSHEDVAAMCGVAESTLTGSLSRGLTRPMRERLSGWIGR